MTSSSRSSEIEHHNRAAWDRLVRQRNRFTRPASDEDCRNPLETVDALGWLGGELHEQRVLCLAAGGGRQSVIYAAAGAQVTVVDLSPAMLELDRQVAAERRLDIRVIETSMTDLSMFHDAEFDVVIHPVSTCYVPDILSVYQSVARVLRGGGLYISQHKTPTSLQASIRPGPEGYVLKHAYYRRDPLPPETGTSLREEGCWEFVHRWEQLIGGMCRSGFVIEDLVEPHHARAEAAPGDFGHRAQFVAPYVRIKARRRDDGQRSSQTPRTLWIPEA